jgi:hypothetical protein
MSFRRYANTDEQEEALGKVEEWSEGTGFKLHYGTSIGQSPQTVILDHGNQDGFVYVNRDGEIKIDDKLIETLEDFEIAIGK